MHTNSAARATNPARLVIVTGAPATGKSTLAADLGSHLGMPVLSKDLIKEALADSLVPTSVQESETLGRAAFTVLYAVAREFLDAGTDLVLEAPFQRGQSEADLKVLVDGVKAAVVVCIASPELLLGRYRMCAFGNARHRGHMDRPRREMTGVVAFDPPALGLPELIVNTSDGYQPSIRTVIDWLSQRLQ